MAAIFAADAAAYAARIAGWEYAEYAMAPERWARAKYHFAKAIWARRNEIAPAKDENGQRLPWRVVFRRMWHDDLAAYVARCAKARAAA